MRERYEIITESVKRLQQDLDNLLSDRFASGSCLSETVRDLERLRETLKKTLRHLDDEAQHRLHAGMCY